MPQIHRMSSKLNILARMLLSQQLSNREAFVEKVSRLIEENFGAEGPDAEKYSDWAAGLLEGLNEQLLMDYLLGKQKDRQKALETEIQELKQLVLDLHNKLDQHLNKSEES